MKKTPIIAGLIGLGILGSAYLGGLYISSNKAMSTLHQLVDSTNSTAGIDYLRVEENKGLFSSTVHLSAFNPLVSHEVGNVQLTLHHGLLSTDIDGKLMLNDARWQNLPLIKNNGGVDVLGHINNFNAKGSFVQVELNDQENDHKPVREGNAFGIAFRTEIVDGFDQSIQDTLHGIIAKGLSEQSPAKGGGRGDGKETSILVSMKAYGPKGRVDIDMPVLHQKNSTATDTSMALSVLVNGSDVLKPNGIGSVSGVSHLTNDKHQMGSYARFGALGNIMLPSGRRGDVGHVLNPSLTAEINEKGAYGVLQSSGMAYQNDEEHIVMGPLSLSLFTDMAAYSQQLDQAAAIKALPEKERLAALTSIAMRLPDVHAELHDMVITQYDDGDKAEKSLKSAAVDISRDLTMPVTHVAFEMRDINDDDVKHANFIQRITLDQPIIDTAVGIFHTLNNTRYQPSSDQVRGFKESILTLLKGSPRIVLNESQFSAENLPHAMNATGELQVLGDTVQRLERFNEKNVKAHFTLTGLPDEVVNYAHDAGFETVRVGEDVNIDMVEGHLTVNGKLIR